MSGILTFTNEVGTIPYGAHIKSSDELAVNGRYGLRLTAGDQHTAYIQLGNSDGTGLNPTIHIFTVLTGTYPEAGKISIGQVYVPTDGEESVFTRRYEISGSGEHRWYTSTGDSYNGTERMILTDGGYLGIGTNNPTATLNVDGDTIIEGQLEVDDFVTFSSGFETDKDVYFHSKLILDGAIGDSFLGIGTNSPTALLHLSGTNNNIKLQNNGYIAAGTSTNQVYLGTNGYVGIGTNNPTTKLHVNGTGMFGSVLGLYSDWTLLGGAGKSIISTLGGGLDFLIAGNTLMTMTGNYIGIGTSTPAYTLDVSGAINTNEGFSINGTAGISTTINLTGTDNCGIELVFSGGILIAENDDICL